MDDLQAITGAARNWTEYTFGSMLLVMCIWHYLTVKFHREEIREWKAELAKEREAHDKTRDRHEADNSALRKLAETMDRLQDGITDIALNRRRA